MKVALNISREKNDRSIKNGKSRETGNIGHKTQNEDNQERERENIKKDVQYGLTKYGVSLRAREW